MLALALILGAALAWLVREWITAPEGWQDSAGFHYGVEPFVPRHSGRSE